MTAVAESSTHEHTSQDGPVVVVLEREFALRRGEAAV